MILADMASHALNLQMPTLDDETISNGLNILREHIASSQHPLVQDEASDAADKAKSD